MNIQVVASFCEYGEAPPWWRRIAARHQSDGDNGGVIDLRKRTLYIDHVPGSVSGHEAYDLHELMHAAFHPPHIKDFTELCESVVLLAIEWAIANSICTPAELRRVAKYQRGTSIDKRGYPASLRREHGFRSSGWWKRAEDRARELGVLSLRGKPTWERPDWKRWKKRWVTEDTAFPPMPKQKKPRPAVIHYPPHMSMFMAARRSNVSGW